jgi:hypothetical protein
LLMLLERPGEVMKRDDLQKRLWPSETFGDFDRGLNRAINRLREALGDDADNPRFIETLPQRGYRFIAQVEAAEPTRVTCPPELSPGTQADRFTASGARRATRLGRHSPRHVTPRCTRGYGRVDSRLASLSRIPPCAINFTKDRVHRGAASRKPLGRSGAGVRIDRSDRPDRLPSGYLADLRHAI